MPLFNVLVEVKTTYFSRIIVEAKDSQCALGYCKNNIDWHEDEVLEEDKAGGRYREHKVKELKEIETVMGLPSGYNTYSHPWNSNGKVNVKEYLDNKENE